ncbi:MAG: hypothetical protein AAF413_00465 [Patescibacteria group bacterium]
MIFFAQVSAFEDLNIKDKDTAVWEIIIMLAVAYLLGFFTYWLINKYEGSVASGPAEASPKKRKVAATMSIKEDLTIIEGIGPKIQEILHAAGVRSYSDLAGSGTTKLKNILEDAGSRYRMHDPASWPRQAKLAASGKMEELEKLKKQL